MEGRVEMKMEFCTPAEIIEAHCAGRTYVLADTRAPDSRAVLVVPAEHADAAAINFLAIHARGLVCLALSGHRAAQLGLALMSDDSSAQKTAFAASIDAREGVSTGISAHDRAITIATAIDHSKTAADLVSPGHVIPVVARVGGVLIRTGAEEAAVDYARLSTGSDAAVVCDIMNDRGETACLSELTDFIRLHELPVGTITDLIRYRRQTEKIIDRAAEVTVPTLLMGSCRAIVYRDITNNLEHVALIKGFPAQDQPTMVRMHRVDLFADLLNLDPKRPNLVQNAMRIIGDYPGPGVIVLIRENSFRQLSSRITQLASENSDVPDDQIIREYGLGAHILRDIGVRDICLLSSTGGQIVGLEAYGLNITEIQLLH